MSVRSHLSWPGLAASPRAALYLIVLLATLIYAHAERLNTKPMDVVRSLLG